MFSKQMTPHSALKSVPMALALLCQLGLAACTAKSSDTLSFDRDHESEPGFYMAAVSDQTPSDPLRQKLSQFFLVEQFNVGALPSMGSAIKSNPPGGILFWNGNKADSSLLRDSIRVYSRQAEAAGLEPLLFSTDYEGGGNPLTPAGTSIAGVQRFVKGFTHLAHPRWLGHSMSGYGQELCKLHGVIMARELKAVGINYPLSVVSDLATQALTSLRGVSKSPADVSRCLVEIMNQFTEVGDLIFVTKHFPGLGLTKGDTHEGTVVSTVKDPEILKLHLQPFLDLISLTKSTGHEGLLSIMTTHAKFMGYDPDHVTTESPKVVHDLLKTQLAFQGLVVSDAMWMGDYGTMDLRHLMPVYLNTFLSGLDLLMIPGMRFGSAVTYFRKVYDGNLTADEKTLLTERTHLSWEETHEKFLARVRESAATLSRARRSIQPAYKSQASALPTTLTENESRRYFEILGRLKGQVH
jgi:beta-glucosidase-like glycosyl hydrolase